MNCFIYVISVVTCKPNLYVFIDSEVHFPCSFYNNVVYTLAAKSFNILEIVLPRPQAPKRQFFSRCVKERFRGLDIQITIVFPLSHSKS
jgi:hypothetical protein